MLDPKITPAVDVGRTRNDLGKIDPIQRDKREASKHKNFKKILEKDDDEEALAEELKARKKSVFDVDMPSKRQKVQPQSQPMQDAQPDLAGLAAANQPQAEKSKGRESKGDDYTESQGDLSSFNPNTSGYVMGQAKAFDIEARTGSSEAPQAARSTQQIVDQILEKIYTIKLDGKTETVLTLKNPPQLIGAEIALTSYDHARGEFNIAIHNLTQAAEAYLEQNNVRLGLKQALEERGYTVHVVTTTSEPFKPTASTEATQSEQRDRRDQEDENQEGRGKRRQK